ncbi:MAG: ATP-binding cassette domain-containing protein [Mycoplasmataceae bacterium]|nr:ATP-binding cassette domain-containing protein [Mycoplasmataceae bacterium]
MLSFKNVTFSYGTNKILDKFNIQFKDNKINCIIGPSAAGKSTLLNLISGTITPQSGYINKTSNKISYLFQEERLINEITVFKNLDLILKGVYQDQNKRTSLIQQGLREVELENIGSWYPDQLSGSMKRRLSLLRAFLYPSQTLLMDEPFTGLDINIKRNVINLFLRLWKKDKRTVVFVSHDLDESLTVANYIYVMSHKPMQVMDTINIKMEHKKRTLYDKQIIAFKKQLINLTKKW